MENGMLSVILQLKSVPLFEGKCHVLPHMLVRHVYDNQDVKPTFHCTPVCNQESVSHMVQSTCLPDSDV